MIIDVVNAILTLNLSYFEWLAMSNIHWIFIFAVVMVYYQNRKKHQIFYVIMLIVMLYSVVGLTGIVKWGFPAMLQYWIIVINVGLVACANWEKINKHKGLLGLLGFYVAWVIYANLGV